MASKMKQMNCWLAAFVVSVLCFGLSSPTCEVVRIPMCKRMPYNMTRMPNLLHHSTQENAILAIEQFEELLDQNCSDVLLFFLCAMYAPICTYEFHSDAIPPCKGVCEQARTGCEPVMNKYNVSWPEGLECTDLPLYDRGVCVSPEAIVSTLPDERRGNGNTAGTGDKEQVHRNQKDCTCKKKGRPTRNLYRKHGYQYAIQGKPVLSVRSGESTVTRVQVLSVIASDKVPVSVGSTVELWSNTTCVCPELTPNKDFLILGFEDRDAGKLLFADTSVAVPWRAKYAKRVKNWAKRSKKSRRSRNGRRRGRKKKGEKRKSGDTGRKSRKNDKKGDRKSRGSNGDKGKNRKNRGQSGKSTRRRQRKGTPSP